MVLSILLVGPLGLAGVALGTAIPNVLLSLLVLMNVACRELGIAPASYLQYVVPRAALGALPILALLLWFKAGLRGQQHCPDSPRRASAMVLLFAMTWVFFVYRDDPYVDLKAHLVRLRAMEPGVSRDRSRRPQARAAAAAATQRSLAVSWLSRSSRDLDLLPEDAAALEALIAAPSPRRRVRVQGVAVRISSPSRPTASSRCWCCCAKGARFAASRRSRFAGRRRTCGSRSSAAATDPIASICWRPAA